MFESINPLTSLFSLLTFLFATTAAWAQWPPLQGLQPPSPTARLNLPTTFHIICWGNEYSAVTSVRIARGYRNFGTADERDYIEIKLRNGYTEGLDLPSGWLEPGRRRYLRNQQRIQWMSPNDDIMVAIQMHFLSSGIGTVTFFRDSSMTANCSELLKQTVMLQCRDINPIATNR